jgi:ubiquinone/menaquinone biosynthesis C-methylase UbiE
MVLKLIKKFYNEDVEDLCTRLLYFFNTIDSFFLFAGFAATAICATGDYPLPWFMVFGVIAIVSILRSDFHPLFILLSLPHLFFVFYLLEIPASLAINSFLACLGITLIIQFVFMGLPDSIVGRDLKIPFVKIIGSLTTIAPTTCSVPISVFFAWVLSLNLLASKNASLASIGDSVVVLASLVVAAGVTWFFRPRSFKSKFCKLPPTKERFKRVVLLNIDGCRFDHFKSLDLPTARRLEAEGTSVKNGATTIYRALTNPAFASILTATPPTIHGVKNNNFGQHIQTQGIPDIVPSILYGSMHVKHFSKDEWNTRIVSLPTTSIYGCDEVMVDMFKDDFENTEDRFFCLDFSEADFLGHAYGSDSKNYKEAIQRVDKRIGDLVDWIRQDGRGEGTGIIVCSDHGMHNIDHSYLLFDAEKYVPFIVVGDGIAKGKEVEGDFSIMDIGLTVCYMLGIPYPKKSKGRVLLEAFEDILPAKEEEKVAALFNRVHYDLEANIYDDSHPEIMSGDRSWYLNKIREVDGSNGHSRPLKVLDYGCGTGFVGEMIFNNKIQCEELVCLDISEGMLTTAKEKLNGNNNIQYVQSLEEVEGKTFDLITINSVLHHLPEPEKILSRLESMLAHGGCIMGGHEPNVAFTYNSLAMLAARVYKGIGGNVEFPEDLVNEFNKKIAEISPGFPRVDREEIQQIVDYHSPIEQSEEVVIAGVGFEGKEFLEKNLPSCQVQSYEEYTTFFCRQGLEKYPSMQKIFDVGYRMLFPGNLFRYVVKKGDAR